MKTLQIKIDCGETTCASEDGDECEFASLDTFGERFRCEAFGPCLEFVNKKLQRCPACLEAEVK